MRTMMMMAALVALAGCGADPAADAPNAAAPAANDAAMTNAQEQVLALPTRLQEGVMLRAIRDARLSCQQVSELKRVDDAGGKARWRVVCDDRTPYVVEIGPDGTAQIRSRR